MKSVPLNLDEIFWEACQISSASERAAYVDRACGENAALRTEVEKLLRAHPKAEQFLEQPAEAALTIDAPIAEGRGATIGPYKLLEQIGEGGMGVVFLAEQRESVRRKVALKIIKPGMDSKQVIARFEAERQALAMMDHPNIARVLDAGTTGEGSRHTPCAVSDGTRSVPTTFGRPYFVMELVKGIAITDYCDQCSLTTRERLELFVSVCQAVQHAHQKGIIHRDVKPSNVLVAVPDGKPVVKVIDFGIAKAINQKLSDHTILTGFHQMIGTPLYVSPEQAEMSPLDVDTRSDVYSLGVLLYELLTGTTPLEKERLSQASFDELRRIIREEEPPRPSARLSTIGDRLSTICAQRRTDSRHLMRAVKGEMDWIVMKCLEKDRNRRYETANGLAADVQRHLNDEPVQACPPSAGYRLRKFARRNKGGLAVTALVLFCLLLLGGSVGWMARDRAARQAKVVGQVELILEEVERLQRKEKWPEALAAAKRAQAALAAGEAHPHIEARVGRLLTDLEMVRKLEDIRTQVMTVVKDEKVFDLEETDRAYSAAFSQYDIAVPLLTVPEAAKRIRARRVAVQLAAALDSWAMSRRQFAKNPSSWKHLLAVARAADPDPWRNQFRDAWERRDKEALKKLAAAGRVTTLPAPTLYLLGSTLRKSGAKPAAEKLLRKAQQLYPDDFWINFELAWCCSQRAPRRGIDDAIRFFTVAIALRKESAGPYRAIAPCLAAKGRLDEAIAANREALRLKPDFWVVHYNLGIVLGRKGELDEAIACLKEAIRLRPKWSWPHAALALSLSKKGMFAEAQAASQEALRLGPTDVTALSMVGEALSTQGKLDEAITCLKKAIHLKPKHVEAHINLGNALNQQGKFDEAIACCRKAIELDPISAGAHNNLGIARNGQGKLDEAIACYRKALALDPKHAFAHNNLGNALKDQGKLDEAVACYRKAIELDPKYASAHNNLAIALRDKGKLDEAIACYRKAIALDPKLAQAHNNLGVALKDQGKVDQAIACYRKAIELDPKDALVHQNLGVALLNQGKRQEAIACFRKAIELDPKDANAHYNLGVALANQGTLDEASKCYRKAIELDPKDARAHYNLGVALSNQGKRQEAIACFRKFIELNPKYAPAHNSLGVTLANQGKLDEAIACYRKAIELDPKIAQAHYNLGVALYDQRMPDEAIACYRKALALDPTYAFAHNNLGNALRDQGKLDEAIACYRKALALDPKYAAAHANLGYTLSRQRKLDEAIACYRKAIELDPKYASAHRNLGVALSGQGKRQEAIACYRKAIELDPKDANAHYNLGVALTNQGKLDEASKCYRKAIAFNPKYAKAHHNLAAVLLVQGKVDEAIGCFKEAIKINPKDPVSYLNLVRALSKQGKVAEAIACYRKIIDLDPNHASAHNNLAWHLATCSDRKLRDPAEAVKLAGKAVKLAPKEGNYQSTLGVALYRTGKWQRAVAALEKSMKLRQGGNGFDWFFLAMAHGQIGDKDKARTWYDQAVTWMDKHQPKNKELHRFRAEAATLLGTKDTPKKKTNSK